MTVPAPTPATPPLQSSRDTIDGARRVLTAARQRIATTRARTRRPLAPTRADSRVYTQPPMTKRKRSTRTVMSFKVPAAIRALMEQIKDRDGVPFSVQLERAMILLAREKGIQS